MVLVCCPLQKKVESGGDIIGLLPTKEDVGQVRKCGKSLRRLNKRKFELKQKDIHQKGGSGGLLEVHVKK